MAVRSASLWFPPVSERGAGLSERFYRELVAPILDECRPGLSYAAARLGSGSDVLGLDDQRSQDHDFGCRLNILLDEDQSDLVEPLTAVLEDALPESFGVWPVRFPVSWRPTPAHNVDVATVGSFAASRLGVDPTGRLGVEDWLCLTGQAVLEVVGGPIFHDSTRQLGAVRQVLSWYPDDVWHYVLSAGWARLSQELPFVGRTGERGDEAGSRIITARLVRDIIHLAFLVERQWPPYPKWAGTVLSALPAGPGLAGELDRAMAAPAWPERQEALAAAIEWLADRQKTAGLPSVSPAVTAFWGRPFLTPDERIQQALWDSISDDEVRRLPRGVGSVEQWSDNVDVLSHPRRRSALRSLYGQWSTNRSTTGS